MFCKNCGNELSERAKFCSKCGNTVKMEEETEENVIDTAPAVTIAEVEAQKAVQEADEVMKKAEEAEADRTEAEESVKQESEASVVPVAESVPEQPKKSRKGIIIGASAAVIAAGAAAVGYFCFSNEIMHLFMGDAGFAAMLEEKSITYLRGGNEEINDIDTALAEYAQQIFYGGEAPEAELTKVVLDEALSVYGDSIVDINVAIEPGMILAIADTEGMLQKFNITSVLEAVQGEECDRISWMLSEDGARTLGADMFISEETVAMLIPELTGETFVIEPPGKEETEEKQTVEFSAKEMKRIRESVQKIYNNNLKNAEFEYTKSGMDLVIAGCPIDSERVIIRISAETLNAMLKEMGDFFRNDEYLRSYYVEATGGDISEYEKNFDEAEYDMTADITVETYFADHAQVTGKKIILTETDSETGESFDFSFETTLGNCDFYIGDDEVAIEFTQRKTDDTSGNMEITVSGEELGAPLVLDVEYSGVGIAEYCGQPVNTGAYTLKLSEKDEFIDYIIKGSSAAESDDMMEEISDIASEAASAVEMLRGIKLISSVECDGTSVKSSFTFEIPLIMDIILSAETKPLEAEKPVMPDCSDAVIMDEDYTMADDEALMQEIYDNLMILSEKSELIGMIMGLAELE